MKRILLRGFVRMLFKLLFKVKISGNGEYSGQGERM